MISAEREAVVAVVMDTVTLVEGARDLMWREMLISRVGSGERYTKWALGVGALLGAAIHQRVQRVVDVETRELVEQLLLHQQGRLPCGHRRHELVAGSRGLIHCRRSLADGRTL